jgi:hypothetical protein
VVALLGRVPVDLLYAPPLHHVTWYGINRSQPVIVFCPCFSVMEPAKMRRKPVQGGREVQRYPQARWTLCPGHKAAGAHPV